jgi:hypothetical protein
MVDVPERAPALRTVYREDVVELDNDNMFSSMRAALPFRGRNHFPPKLTDSLTPSNVDEREYTPAFDGAWPHRNLLRCK